jgi:hypothetical protein
LRVRRHGELVAHVRNHRRRDPDTHPCSQRERVDEGRRGVDNSDRKRDDGGEQHGQCQAVHPAHVRALRHPVAENDVEREQDGVGRGEGEAERLRDQADVREQVHPRDGEDEREEVAAAARADRGQDDDGKELDRGDGAEWQPVDGQVEQAVHHREHRGPGAEQPPGSTVEHPPDPPGPAPHGEDQRSGGDAQPRHSQGLDAGEQEHRERRPEVVEDRRHHEVRVRWNASFLHEPGA